MNNLKYYALIGAFAVSGCAHNPINFRPTMGADSSQIGYEAVALINELQKAYVADPASTTCLKSISPSYQNVASEGFRRLQENGERHEVTVKKLGCITYRTGDAAAFKAHFEAGVALSDLYCDDYFRRIAVHKQKRQFGRSTTNDLGTAVSSVLGLASAGSIATGGAGVLFGLGDGLWRNYDTAFLVEPDLGKMLELVRINQRTMRNQYGGDAKFGSYFEANSAINEYAQLCSYAGMDKLLNKALEIATNEQTIDQTVTRFQTARARASATAAETNLDLVKRKVKADAEAAKLLGQGPGKQ